MAGMRHTATYRTIIFDSNGVMETIPVVGQVFYAK